MGERRSRIGIVGGGVAGLTAAYLLQRVHDVTLFEASGRLGGNAYTATTSRGERADIAVAAFGKAGYPLFYRLLDELGVRTRLSLSAYMSFQDLDTGEGLYLTPTLAGLWAQRFASLRPRHLLAFLRVLLGVHRGRWRSRRGAFKDASGRGPTLGEALSALPELSGEAELILLSALCLLSSMSASEVLDAPAAFFFEKLDVHHDIISPKALTSVRTVEGFTAAYIDALARPLGDRVQRSAPAQRVTRDERGVTLLLASGAERRFDRIVLATGADQALSLLADPSEDEARLLGAWRYKAGRVVLHRDRSSFPPRALSQAYTFLYTRRGGVLETSVNGDLRYEPGVSPDSDLVSSQHPNFPIDPTKIELDTVLRTPIFDFDAVASLPALPRLNGARRTYYCGSYLGHGLHEDAVRSAMTVAALLGAPFKPQRRGAR